MFRNLLRNSRQRHQPLFKIRLFTDYNIQKQRTLAMITADRTLQVVEIATKWRLTYKANSLERFTSNYTTLFKQAQSVKQYYGIKFAASKQLSLFKPFKRYRNQIDPYEDKYYIVFFFKQKRVIN